MDVCIVGAGPSGLSAAIKLKQHDPSLSVLVLEKGSEVGSHILSGCCLKPRALDELIPDWKQRKDCKVKLPVVEDKFLFLRDHQTHYSVPEFLMPPVLSNHRNYIVSLGELVKWLGAGAESLGCDIYPGFPGKEVLINEKGFVEGIATADIGLDKDGKPKEGVF